MTFLESIDRLLVKAETALIVLFLGAMVLLAFAQVVLRNIFDTGLLWGDPLVRHLVLWVGFTGAAVATSERRHISIDALTKFFPPRMKSIAHVITNVFALYVCLVLADAAFTFLAGEKEAGGMITLSIPSWVGIVIIPPGYALIAFHFVVKLVESIAAVFGNQPEPT